MILRLGGLASQFSGVERATQHPDGRRENDVEHSFSLALIAYEIATSCYPKLDKGLVVQFALLHDLPEVYAGDVWTFGISDEARVQKELDEKQAIVRLLQEIPPHLAQLLRRYEQQTEQEARFVRLVDKLMPAVTIVLAGVASTFNDDFDVSTLHELQAGRPERAARLREQFPEFPLLHELRVELSELVDKTLFPEG